MALKFTGFNALVDQDSPNREPNRAREPHASSQNERAIPRPPCAHTSVAHMGAMHESNVRASIGVFEASRAPHANPSDPRRRNDSHEKAKMLSSHAPALRPRGDASLVSTHVSSPNAAARARKSSTFPFFGATHHTAASFARTPPTRATNVANTANGIARMPNPNHERDASDPIERKTRETNRTNERANARVDECGRRRARARVSQRIFVSLHRPHRSIDRRPRRSRRAPRAFARAISSHRATDA